MRSWLGPAATLSMLALGLAAAAWAQEGLTKQDRRGPVTVAVTLLAPPAAGAPLKAKVVLDTHSVGLDDIAFERAVVMRAGGAEIAPAAVEARGGGHHREAVLTFPAPAAPGPIVIVVKGVGGVAERAFAWEAGPPR